MNNRLKINKEFLHGIKHVLDIGCSDGRWTAANIDMFPEDTKFHLLDPIKYDNRHLEDNPRVTYHQAAVTEWGPKYAGLLVSEDKFGSTIMPVADYMSDTYEPVLNTYDANLLPFQGVELGELAEFLGLDPNEPTFMKLDVHGQEFDILNAMYNKWNVPFVLVEVYNYPQGVSPDAVNIARILELMEVLSYKLAVVQDVMHRPCDGLLWQMDLLFAEANHHPTVQQITYEPGASLPFKEVDH